MLNLTAGSHYIAVTGITLYLVRKLAEWYTPFYAYRKEKKEIVRDFEIEFKIITYYFYIY